MGSVPGYTLHMARLPTIGIAPLLAAVLIAGLCVAGVLMPLGVGADRCDLETAEAEEEHDDFHGVSCTESGHDDPHQEVIEVDAGRDRELVFKVFPPDDSYLNDGDQIEITLTEFDLSDFQDDRASELITITDNVDPPNEDPDPTPTNVEISDSNLVLTIPDLTQHTDGPGEHLSIIIKKGTGILTPETPAGFDDDPSEGYKVPITFVDAGMDRRLPAKDENIVVVKNPVSSTVPGAAVRVELATFAEAPIHSTDEITVDFSGPSAGTGFILPRSMVKSRIQIRYKSNGLDKSVNPSEVLLQGEKVVLTVPTVDDLPITVTGDYTISFSQTAGIKNPFSAGNRVITVSSFVPGDEDDEIIAVIRRTTTISPQEGPRGSEFTLEGKGYAQGTVTVFDGDDDRIGPGETLASVETVRGAFKVKLKVGGEGGEPVYTVRTKDSYGVDHSVNFLIASSMSFEPASVGVGSRLRIMVSDWNEEQMGIAAVRIAGQPAYTAGAGERAGCFEDSALSRPDDDSVVTVDVIVPPEVPPGRQTVSIYGPDQLDATDEDDCLALRDEPNPIMTKTVEIAAQALALSPDSAARGEKITITGSGFTQAAGGGDDIHSVSIGGIAVDEDPSAFEVGSGGDVTLIVTVPLEVSNGSNEVRVEGADNILGQATLMIPEAAITLEPEASRRGTEVEVTGSGFLANGLVSLTYGEGADIAGALADSRGNVSLTFTVPNSAVIGKTNPVTAVAEAASNGRTTGVRAESGHSTPVPVITTTPDPAGPGDSLTVRGENLPLYSAVAGLEIDGKEMTPRLGSNTDGDGAFEVKVIMPFAEPGDQTLRVEVAGLVVFHTIAVVGPARPSEAVFKTLIDAGVLVVVWRYDETEGTWAFFDPRPELAGVNDLTGVRSGDDLWVNLAERWEFQGDELLPRWNFITLD